MSQALEDLLKSQYTNPVDSSGSFTMQTEKALEKIAKYQLPYPDAWVVKLGQGVVLSSAEELSIHQTPTDTTFVFSPPQILEIDFLSSFFDPSEHPIPWWQNFRSSLWAVGLNLRRPFKLDFFDQSYFWDGFELHNFESSSPTLKGSRKITLDISHRTAEQGKGYPIVRSIQAAWLNSHLSTVFSEVLFSCPMRVRLDGRRVDGFQRVSGHGFSQENHPVKMFWVEGKPELPIPPSTRDNFGHFLGSNSKLETLTDLFDSRPPETSVRGAALLSAHAYYVSGKNGGWRIPKNKSVIYWIRHGVAVQKEEFNMPASCLSLAVFAPCDHIKTDITGFGLEESQKATDLREICRGINRILKSEDFELVLHDREQHKLLWKVAGGVAASGLVLKFVFPPAIFLAGAGGYGALMLTNTIAKVDSAINKEIQKLPEEWHKLCLSLGGGASVD